MPMYKNISGKTLYLNLRFATIPRKLSAERHKIEPGQHFTAHTTEIDDALLSGETPKLERMLDVPTNDQLEAKPWHPWH